MGVQAPKYFPLTGGLDLKTPAIEISPGKMIGCSNFEQNSLGGYSRIGGYERDDGRGLPSEASYWVLSFDTGAIAEVVEGQICVGQTSGARGVVLFETVTSGSWVGGDAAGILIMYQVVGTFIDDEPLSFSGVGDGFDVGFDGGFG